MTSKSSYAYCCECERAAASGVQGVNDLLFRAAGELAALVRSGELSARELLSASLERIEEVEPQINAFTHVAY